jgi:murein DD-endopeptidase MepM/ murein hydrolase activator NlpD
MKEGVTPELRIKVRNRDLSPDDRRRYKKRQTWRKKKKRQFTGGAVARPVNKIIEDSWGYHPGVHDGVDIITPPDPAIYAICDATVVRVSDDWWGLGSPGGALADRGDGIIIIRASNDVGPIRKGDNICYGHAEHPAVHVGQHVQAGHRIGHAGFANAWHIHFMVNHRSDTKGVGDRDPRPVIDYVVKHG